LGLIIRPALVMFDARIDLQLRDLTLIEFVDHYGGRMVEHIFLSYLRVLMAPQSNEPRFLMKLRV
jgi:hypothetical protein